jgi:hypothetical protein
MHFNPYAFLLGRAIAQNRGTTSSPATSDGLIGGVISNGRTESAVEAELVGAAGTATPTITGVSASGRQVTVNGSGFATTTSDLDVLFNFVDSTGLIRTTISVHLQGVNVTPTQFTMTLPPGVATNYPVSIVLLVQSRASNVFETSIAYPIP